MVFLDFFFGFFSDDVLGWGPSDRLQQRFDDVAGQLQLLVDGLHRQLSLHQNVERVVEVLKARLLPHLLLLETCFDQPKSECGLVCQRGM